jgi:hypothetical protein
MAAPEEDTLDREAGAAKEDTGTASIRKEISSVNHLFIPFSYLSVKIRKLLIEKYIQIHAFFT